MSYVTITQIFRQGGFTNAAGTVNFLRSIDGDKVRVDWEEMQIGGLNLANIEMVKSFEDTTDFQAGNWVYYALGGGTLTATAGAGATSVSVTGLGDSTAQSPNILTNPLGINGTNNWTILGTPGGTDSWSATTGGFHASRSGSTANADYVLYQQFTTQGGGISISGTLRLANLTLGSGGIGAWVDLYDATATTVLVSAPVYSINGTNSFSVQSPVTISGHALQLRLRTAFQTGDAYFTNVYCCYTTPIQTDILVNDYVIISDGVNSDLMQVTAVAPNYPNYTLTLGAAPGQNTSSLLNSYAAGTTIARLQFSGYLLARNTRTTNLNGKYIVQVQGFSSRYNNVLCNADIVQQDCATSIYNLCNSYAPTLPEIIISSGNFSAANGYHCTTQSQNAKVLKVVTDIIKTENSQNANVNYAFWVDRVRQAHHGTIPGANTATPNGSLGYAGGTLTSPTYTIDIATPGNGSYYESLGPIDATDMDMSQMVNTAIVQGGQLASTKQPLSVIVQDQTSQAAWGYWEGVFSNPDLTDETTAAQWGAGQLCLTAYPRTTAKTTFVSSAARLSCRDLLQVQGFTDGSVMQFNPTRIKYNADDRQRMITGDMDLAQARPDIGAIMTAGQNQVSIRNLSVKPPTNLDTLYVVSGFGISNTGLNLTIAAGVVSYNGVLYNVPQYTHTMPSSGQVVFGAQVSGTAIGGVTLPSVVIMPNTTALSTLYANNLYSVTRPGSQGSPITITANTNFIGVQIWRVTSTNGAISGEQDLRTFGGVGSHNMIPVAYANGLWDSTNNLFDHNKAMSFGVQSAVDSSGNILNTLFPSGKMQSNGTLTNVDLAFSNSKPILEPGTTITMTAMIARGNTTGNAGLWIGDGSDQTGFWFAQQNSSTVTLFQQVGGVPTALGSITGTLDTLPHTFVLCIYSTAASTQQVEAYWDGNVVGTGVYSGTLAFFTGQVSPQLFTSGSTGILHQYSCVSSNHPHLSMPNPYRNNFDGAGNARKTSMLNTNVPSVLPFSTDGLMHLVSPSGQTYMNVYIDNGTAGTACHIYLPDGTSVVPPALSGTTLTTVASNGSYTTTTTNSNGIHFTGCSSGATYYFMASYNPINGLWTIAISPSNTAFTALQQQAMFSDGGYICFEGSATGTSWTGGGGTGSHQGCPEVDQELFIKRASGAIEYAAAKTLSVGDYLLDPDGDWNEVFRAGIDDAEIWEVAFDTETIRVDASHLFDQTGNLDWINVKNLKRGDRLMRYGGGRIVVESVKNIGMGQFVHIGCHRMRYVLGKTVSHNQKLK